MTLGSKVRIAIRLKSWSSFLSSLFSEKEMKESVSKSLRDTLEQQAKRTLEKEGCCSRSTVERSNLKFFFVPAGPRNIFPPPFESKARVKTGNGLFFFSLL